MSFLNELEIGTLTVDRILGGGNYKAAGTEYFVDPVNGSDGNNGKSPKRAKKTLAAAEALCVAGKNDVVYFLAGTSGDTQVAANSVLLWDKDYTHLIGVCATAAESHRARIFSPATAAAAYSPMVTFSGQGCVVRNLSFKMQSYHADSHYCATVSGGRNLFENVHFAGILHATPGADTAASSLVLDGAEENLFKNCVIGQDTIASTAANAHLRMTTTRSNRNKFDGCLFYTNAAAGTFWAIIGAEAIGGYVWFKDCVFLNKGTTMSYGMSIGANTGGNVILDNVMWQGATDLQDNNAACLIGRTPTVLFADGGKMAAQTKS